MIHRRRISSHTAAQRSITPEFRSEKGQSLVEFALIVPVFVLILFGMLEFGFVFSHNLTLQYATREGAGTGALLADGGTLTTPCGTVDPDPYIIAAVQRVLDSQGSPIDLSQVPQIRIYSASLTGPRRVPSMSGTTPALEAARRWTT